jgi:bifunctional non-homologous end joining protein LigD
MSRVAPLKFIEPQLASPVDQPPEGKSWIHEIKYDGYRTQLLLEPEQARAFTRNGFDFSDRYPAIIRAASHLPCHSAIIDGEAILPRGDGPSDFEAFQSAVHDNPHIILYAFDLACRWDRPAARIARSSPLYLEGPNWNG